MAQHHVTVTRRLQFNAAHRVHNPALSDEENARIFDFSLSDEDMAELGALDETGATDRALERKWW